MKHTLRYLSSFLLILAFGLTFVISSQKDTAQATSHPCANPASLFISQPTSTSLALMQQVRLQSSSPLPIERVKFLINDKVLGVGKKDYTSGTSEQWFMMWDTRLSKSDPYQIRAEVTRGGETCVTQPISVLDAVSLANFNVDIMPPEWTGPTNVTQVFNISGIGPGGSYFNDILPFAEIEWSIDGVGSISSIHHGAVEFISPVAGNSEVEAVVRYGGKTYSLDTDITVTSQYTSSSSGSGSSNSGSDSSNDEDDDEASLVRLQEPKVEPAEAFTQVIESSDTLRTCLSERLGSEVVQRVQSENRRPSSTEFAQYIRCFEGQGFVIPNILAPVAPEDVVSKKESSNVRFANISNRKITKSNGDEATALVLSGTTKPNSNVLIYVFSEPLVLAATADENGNWEYVLEDPLPSGEHEVYALVDRGDGEYERSTVASFFIGTAEATEENPNGYSLELISEPTITANNRSVNVFIAGTIGIIVFTITAFSGFLIYRYRNKDAGGSGGPEAPGPGDQIMPTNTV